MKKLLGRIQSLAVVETVHDWISAGEPAFWRAQREYWWVLFVPMVSTCRVSQDGTGGHYSRNIDALQK